MIGIFDSGFGGLSIFKDISGLLPEYDYMYLGDSVRAPYGNRTQDILYDFSLKAVEYLFKNGCELIIIACGTASSEALRKLQQEYLTQNYLNKRILGIIRPLVEEAVRKIKFGKVGVVGTNSTIRSKSFEIELKKERGDLQIHQKACPRLVPLIEEGWKGDLEKKKILEEYLKDLKEKEVDTLVLGCTHYSLIFNEFREIMGRGCNVIESGKVVARSLGDYLKRHPEIESKLSKKGKRFFYTTDDAVMFARLGSRFFGEEFEAEKIEL